MYCASIASSNATHSTGAYLQVYHVDTGALHMGPCIRIRGGSGIRIQRPCCLHTASIWIRAACCAVWQCSGAVRDDPVQQCNEPSLRVMWSSRLTTMNPVPVPMWRAPQSGYGSPRRIGIDLHLCSRVASAIIFMLHATASIYHVYACKAVLYCGEYVDMHKHKLIYLISFVHLFLWKSICRMNRVIGLCSVLKMQNVLIIFHVGKCFQVLYNIFQRLIFALNWIPASKILFF